MSVHMATSALEWVMRNEIAQRVLRDVSARMHREHMAMLDLCIRRHAGYIFRLGPARPHTDDMMQMCVDLGVDVPEVPRAPEIVTITWDQLFRETHL